MRNHLSHASDSFYETRDWERLGLAREIGTLSGIPSFKVGILLNVFNAISIVF